MTALCGVTLLRNRSDSAITQLLAAASTGDAAARERLWEVVYDELHRIAGSQMAREATGATLQPTALINEAYLRLVGDGNVEWANWRHFFAAAAKAMRRIRVDYARKRKSLKRGGAGIVSQDPPGMPPDGRPCESVEELAHPRGKNRAPPPIEQVGVFDRDPDEVLAIDEALARLERTDARQAEVVVLRFFAGLTVDETADVLGISPRTVDSTWRFAKAWLFRELSAEKRDANG